MNNLENAKDILTYDSVNGKLYWAAPARPRIVVGTEAGFINKRGYSVFKYKCKSYRTSRVIWFMHYGYWPTLLIDHIDGNKSNNVVTNLREATVQQNNSNCAKQNSHYKYKGVRPTAGGNKYQARIRVSRKELCLGNFETEESAAMAYDAAAEHYFGQFAKTNKMLGLLHC